jgi:Flp pilus assembly protein TadG
VVASASSSQPFSLDGQSMPAHTGVASWPMVAGDQITTSSAPVALTLSNGAQVTVQPNSTVKVTSVNGQANVLVLSGSTSTTEGGLEGPDIRPKPVSSHR